MVRWQNNTNRNKTIEVVALNVGGRKLWSTYLITKKKILLFSKTKNGVGKMEAMKQAVAYMAKHK